MPTGGIKGARIRGKFGTDVAWKGGRLTQAAIHSKLGGPCRLRYRDATGVVEMKPGGAYAVYADLKPANP